MADVKYAVQALREYATYKEELLDSHSNPVLDENGMTTEVTSYHPLPQKVFGDRIWWTESMHITTIPTTTARNLWRTILSTPFRLLETPTSTA